MRGLEKVRAEFSLTALAYNMTRVLTIVILTPTTSLLRMWQAEELFRRAPERCLKISTAIFSACRCLSNDDISNSIRAIAAINPPSTTGGSLLG